MDGVTLEHRPETGLAVFATRSIPAGTVVMKLPAQVKLDALTPLPVQQALSVISTQCHREPYCNSSLPVAAALLYIGSCFN